MVDQNKIARVFRQSRWRNGWKYSIDIGAEFSILATGLAEHIDAHYEKSVLASIVEYNHGARAGEREDGTMYWYIDCSYSDAAVYFEVEDFPDILNRALSAHGYTVVREQLSAKSIHPEFTDILPQPPLADLKIAMVYMDSNKKGNMTRNVYVIKLEDKPTGIINRLNEACIQDMGAGYVFGTRVDKFYDQTTGVTTSEANLECFQSVVTIDQLNMMLRDAGYIMRTLFPSKYCIPVFQSKIKMTVTFDDGTTIIRGDE